jgi:hypothetical protein
LDRMRQRCGLQIEKGLQVKKRVSLCCYPVVPIQIS